MSDLSNRVVVVTGGGGRLGRVLVRQLVESGARVVALDRAVPDDLPDGVTGAAVDLTNEADVTRAFAELADAMGAPWALIHTVGTWDGGPLTETSLDAWRHVLDLNLTSTFLCVREATKHMEAGRIVGITSRQGADRAPAQQAAYAASKAGVVRLLEAASAENGSIACVAVAPSMILFGGEDVGTAGVSVEAVASLCVRLCGNEGAVHDGAVLRAYGDG